MRKGHIKILERARQYGLPDIYIQYLEASPAPINELNNLFVFLHQRMLWKVGSCEDFELFKRINAAGVYLGIIWDYVIWDYAAALEGKVIEDILQTAKSSELIFRAMNIAVSNNISGEKAVKLAEEAEKGSVLYELLIYNDKAVYDLEFRKIVRSYTVEEKIKLAELYKVVKESSGMPEEKFVKLAGTYIISGKLPILLGNALKNEKVLKERLHGLSPCCIESGEDIREISSMVQYREKLEKIVGEYEITKTLFLETDIPLAIYSFSNAAVNIYFKRIASVLYDVGNERFLFSYKKSCFEDEYVIFFDSLEVYIKRRGKLIPASLKNIQYSIRDYGKCAENIFSMICDMHSEQGEYIWKDIKLIMLSGHVSFMPLQFRELKGMTGIRNLCETKYIRDIPVNWNKGDFDINYLTYKSYLYIVVEDRNILLNECRHMSDPASVSAFHKFVDSYSLRNVRYVILFPLYIIYQKLDRKSFWKDADGNMVSEHDVLVSVIDYLHLLLELKRKIPLRFRSAKKLKAAHDEASVAYAEKTDGIPLIKIPKNSKFDMLRKILPESFEWITTRKRIILEGRNMHHCVTSYANKVNKDLCAIYSFVYPETEKRYTVEFVQRKDGTYYMNQIQSMCDRGAPDEVKQYVLNFIEMGAKYRRNRG